MIDPNNIPPTTTVASGRCTSLPMPVEIAAGKSPIPADKLIINNGRIKPDAAENIASVGVPPRSRAWL